MTNCQREYRPLTIAQIGVGYWGPNLLRNLITNRKCWVKSVCDTSSDRRDYVKNLYPGVAVTSDIKEVLNDSQLDAIVVATPAKSHFEIAMNALKQGKHVLIEKPMATSPEEIDEIQAMALRMGRVAMAGHTFLYNTAVHYLKALIDSGEIGKVRYIYSHRVNLGRIRSDVDALWNLAPHDVSIIQYLLGDPEPVSVSREGMDFIQPGIEDVVFLHICYPEKVMAHVHVSWLDPNKIRRMTVVGTRKMVVYDDIADNKIAIYDKGIDRKAVLGENMDYDDLHRFEFNHRSGDMLLPKIQLQEPLKMEIDHFCDCILQGVPCLTGPSHARKVVEILSQ